MNIDQLFSGIANAKIAGRGTNMGEGLFTVETKALVVKKSEDVMKPTNWFILEFTVLTSNNPAHAPGSTASWVLNMSNVYTPGNIKELVLALLGYENTKANQDDSEIGEQVDISVRAALGSTAAAAQLAELRAAFGPDYGKLIGVKLGLETKIRATKPRDGKPSGQYTGHKWSPVVAVAA